MALKPGDTLDRYTLVSPLGSGGQASVWRVKDPLNPERDFAAKLTPMALTSDASIERLRREARQLVRLEHPSLVKSHALFEDLQRDVLGLVMSFVDGEALDTALERGALGSDHKWWLLRHLASALAYIHEKQLVHRDLKLQNVLLERRFFTNPAEPSHVKLVDFGIAAPVINDRPITQVGHVVGTPPYLAPESLEPFHWRFPVGPAVDVFAFGVLIWRLFCSGHPTGLPPGSTLLDYGRVYRQAAERGAWPPPTGKPGLDQLLAATLAVRADQRAPDGAALVALLDQRVLPQPAPGDTTVPDAPPFAPDPHSLSTSAPQVYSVGQAQGGAQTDSYVGTPAPPPMQVPAPVPHRGASANTTLAVSGCLFLLALGGGGLLAALYAGGLFDPEPQATAQAKPVRTVVRPTAAPASTPEPEPEPTPQPAFRPEPTPEPVASRPKGCPTSADLCSCCPGKGCCPSGNDCQGDCGESLGSSSTFYLRYAGGGDERSSLEKSHWNSKVCVTVHGTERRMCIHTSPTHPDHNTGLPITGYDLGVRGLDIEVRSWTGATLATRTEYRQNFTRSVLCKGFNVTRVSGSPDVTQVGFFVDPLPTSMPNRCVK
ncbi:MAG: serine/threonine-protein kinase [Polyangiaceae bacterium]